MTAAAMSRPPTLPVAGKAARWGVAGATVLAAHALALYLLYDLAPPDPPSPPALQQSLEVELAPLELSRADAVASEALPPTETPDRLEPAETPPGAIEPAAEPLAPRESDRLAAAEPDAPLEPLEQAEPAEPETAAPRAAEPFAQQPSEPDTLAAESAQPLQPVEQPAPLQSAEPARALAPLTVTPAPSAAAEVLLPEQPEALQPAENFAETPETVASLPRERPEPEAARPQPRRETRPRREKPPERPRPRRGDQPAPQRQQRPAPPPSTPSSPSRGASAPRIDPGRWQSQVQARVARSLQGLRGRGFAGRMSVRFTVSASGAISGARVARSSGDGATDQAAVAAVGRVSVPPPPPGATRTLTIPVRFD
jgi:periplasmic protein TonB